MKRQIFPSRSPVFGAAMTRFGLSASLGLVAAAAALAPGRVPEAFAQEAAACLSDDPAAWPASAKPYFMLVVDTSGSMTACTNPPTAYPTECPSNPTLNSCGMIPNRLNDAKCALRNTIQAFSGQVNFGLSTFASFLTNCNAGACASDCGTPNGGQCQSDFYSGSNCSFNVFEDAVTDINGNALACGNRPDCDLGGGQGLLPPSFTEGTWLNGGNIVVPMKRDGDADNTTTLLQWFDGQCDGNREIFAAGGTPIAGSLRSTANYLRDGWAQWRSAGDGNYCEAAPGFTHTTPLSAADPACRPVNIIMLTDGDDNCGGNAAQSQAAAVAAAQDLFDNGATFGGTTFDIRTYVINFAGGTQANTNAIAAAGGTGTSLSANNETTLAQALSTIIAGSVAPEVCDNTDNNCNGCTDEGYRHHCNTNAVCCTDTRATCLQDYEDSITAADPDGDLDLLPCVDATGAAQPASWLCFNPGEDCDDEDNNCVSGVDEGVTKCGNPLACPGPEVCDGRDNDCDGVVDDGVCGGCVPQPEVCDGCDNDCDGVVDDGIAAIACGIPGGACAGTRTCTTLQVNVPAGQCSGGASFSACSTQGAAETCNGIDDDCDGIIDEGVPPQACVPAGTPGGLVFGGTSQCSQGQQACTGQGAFGPCVGFQGPSVEVCDGIDNDCDGQVDEGSSGVGQECGINAPPSCTPGLTACVNGALECQGENGGGPEVCNGVDDDCDGATDEAPLTDAPAAGQNGCWQEPGNCCSHQGFSWCPPPGAGCNDAGSLVAPCSLGTLACEAGGWTCTNDVGPGAEVCDGLDNDCDGVADDGTFIGEGEVCGDGDAPCMTGLTECTGGFLDCVGDVPPQAEICDGVDNDCDGEVDEGIVVGGTCIPEYDEVDYPGERIFPAGPCQLGTLVCDGDGGTRCDGGSGPQPEICDGIDNDCDGTPDETGDAPNGIDGTDNPDDPNETIGDACGVNEGICAEGALACLNGRFECLGGQPPQVETCDCQDNDCDGSPDNQNPGNDPPLCGEGKECVNTGSGCQCAAPCSSGEFPCPGGQTCETVDLSETGEELDQSYCIADTCPGGCADKTFTDGDGTVRCAPLGTVLDDCRTVPECECKGQNGCVNPCFGVTCEQPLVCARFGDQAGTCVPDNCFNVGCQGCDVFCGPAGECVGNPCTDADCAADEACIPSDDGSSFTCKASCADVECEDGTVCKSGACVAECDPACAADEVCDFSQTPSTCVESQCNAESCPNGGCCDPLTGACGTCPCEGVTCPQGEVCLDDECVDPGGAGGGGVGGGATGSTATSGAGGEGAGSVGATGVTGSNGAGPSSGSGVFGLATGGGGCQCEVGVGATDGGMGRFAAAIAAGMLVVARRRKRGGTADRRCGATGEVAR